VASVADAAKRLNAQLDRIGATNVTVSTNIRPQLGRAIETPDHNDPGVAVYFSLKRKSNPTPMQCCLPCDRWARVADNIAAVAKHVEAMRGMERWGVGTLEQAFTGYKALTDGFNWRNFFGDLHTPDAVRARHRELAKELHPDAGGDTRRMSELNRARDEALREMESRR
jgi:hypothetical protein